MGLYIVEADVNQKALETPIGQAGWVTADIDSRIADAEGYVESCLIALGHDLLVLRVSKPQIVKTLCKFYAKYLVVRDLFSSRGQKKDIEEGDRYLKEFKDLLKQLKDGDIALVDPTTALIVEGENSRNEGMETNVDAVNRAVDAGDPTNWDIDENYADDAVTGDEPRLGDTDC